AATRSGLFRSPVSGGVESATSAHGLPAPAVAVRNLVEQAQYAQLCSIMSRSHHRRKGYPFGSLVDFTTDADGHPVFLLSPLGMHSRNLQSDPRCTVVVQIPGWSGLANARATIFGDLYPLPPSQQEWARGFYVKRHQHGAAQQWGNFHFYRMDTICDIYFVGGFGTVAWIDVAEYVAATPDTVATNHVEHTLQELNDRLGGELRAVLAGSSPQQAIDDASFISIDSKGVDIRVRHGTQAIDDASFISIDSKGVDIRVRHGTQATQGSSPQQAIDDASFISIDSKGVDIRVRHGTQRAMDDASFISIDSKAVDIRVRHGTQVSRGVHMFIEGLCG
ncbi:unnamed protein product, partial [Closterium sp. Yama58-4]